MTQTTGQLPKPLHDYLLEYGVAETPLLAQLRDETSKNSMARMQISPEQGQFMSVLVSLIKPMRILEIGTFTGYSSLVMAASSSDECKLLTLDLSEEWTNTAKRYWAQAGVEEKIELKLGSALITLQALAKEHIEPVFDLVFLDADKENYPEYLCLIKPLLKVGGVLLVDNVFWGGSVSDETNQELSTKGVRKLNAILKDDKEFELSMIPISDGLTIAKKII